MQIKLRWLWWECWNKELAGIVSTQWVTSRGINQLCNLTRPLKKMQLSLCIKIASFSLLEWQSCCFFLNILRSLNLAIYVPEAIEQMEHARQKFYLACISPSIPRKRAHSLSSCVPKQHIWGKFYYCCESNPPAKSWQYSHTCWRMLLE